MTLIEKIKGVLIKENTGELHQAMRPVPNKPFGQERLKALGLLRQIVKFQKLQVYQALYKTEILQIFPALIAEYPWNNFLQLKVHSIFEDSLTDPQLTAT